MKKYKSLDELFADQSEAKLSQINMLRDIVLGAEPGLVETIKWNAPNYIYKGEDRITFNLMNKQNQVRLIIHMGSTKKENVAGRPVLPDDKGIVKWNSDIRGTISFDDISEIQQKKLPLQTVIKNWLSISTK